jgi:phosphatidylethanolamine-binding protein (PEBP) family uncharacterized protein
MVPLGRGRHPRDREVPAGGCRRARGQATAQGGVPAQRGRRYAALHRRGPPPGSGLHKLYITVTALKVPTTKLNAKSSCALLGFTGAGNTIARATLVMTAEG